MCNLIMCCRRKKFNSLIHNDDKIDIISVSDLSIDKENLLNYLHNNILKENVQFNRVLLSSPIYIKFTFRNETYSMCLKNLKSTHYEHSEIIERPFILCATIDNLSKTCVTDEIREFQGHYLNFWEHIPDVITDLGTIFKDFKGNYMNVFNLNNEIICYSL